MSTPRRGFVFASETNANNFVAAVNARLGWPRPMQRAEYEQVGGGVHIPPARLEQRSLLWVKKHPTRALWIVLDHPRLIELAQRGLALPAVVDIPPEVFDDPE